MEQIVAGLNLAYLTSIWQVVAAILVYLVSWGILHVFVLSLTEYSSRMKEKREFKYFLKEKFFKILAENFRLEIDGKIRLKEFQIDLLNLPTENPEDPKEAFINELLSLFDESTGKDLNEGILDQDLIKEYSSQEVEQKFYISKLLHGPYKTWVFFLILPLIREAGKIKVSASILTTWLSLRFWILKTCGICFLTSNSTLTIIVLGVALYIGFVGICNLIENIRLQDKKE